jgi:hypothetical protein
MQTPQIGKVYHFMNTLERVVAITKIENPPEIKYDDGSSYTPSARYTVRIENVDQTSKFFGTQINTPWTASGFIPA